MSFKSLADRLDALPLILAGPIVRRTEPKEVTVWIALKEKRRVTLRIYEVETAGGSPTLRLSGTQSTIQLGKHLYVTAVTAKKENVPGADALDWGKSYSYNLFFDENVTEEGDVEEDEHLGLNGSDIVSLDPVEILYYPDSKLPLPSFALPPVHLDELRLLHGSCRKPHGEGLDALSTVDEMIGIALKAKTIRPHQLFLTGDQIYADDVADPLLYMLSDAATTLVHGGDEEEKLPSVPDSGLPAAGGPPSTLLPRARSNLVESAGMTTGEGKSHLLGLAEFFTMYLFAWSPVCWPAAADFPDFDKVLSPRFPKEKTVYLGPREQPRKIRSSESFEFSHEIQRITTFRESLRQVRRALANISTYMIWDDHEITDDWFLNYGWSIKVMENRLGNRIMLNGAVAYAIFQSWGNTPKQFKKTTPYSSDEPGHKLLTTVQSWQQIYNSATQMATELENDLAKLLGMPDIQVLKNERVLSPLAGTTPLTWSYVVSALNHQVIVLDTRTRRGFPSSGTSNKQDGETPPALLEAATLAEQVRLDPNASRPEFLFIVSPGPVFGVPLIDTVQDIIALIDVEEADYESWRLNPNALEALLSSAIVLNTTAHSGQWKYSKIVFLSGDVHYGFSLRLQYEGTKPFKKAYESNRRAVAVQLTASSFKNETRDTRLVHNTGYKPDPFNIFEFDWWNELPDPEQLVGWHTSSPDVKLPGLILQMLSKTPPMVRVTDLPQGTTFGNPPEWRYRIDYLVADNTVREPAPFTPKEVVSPPAGDRRKALREYMAASENHKDYASKWGDGKEIVGVNNMGEVSFVLESNGIEYAIVHELWWRLRGQTGPMLPTFPLTRFEIPMTYTTDLPMPEIELEDD